jgi:hypothetical protein
VRLGPNNDALFALVWVIPTKFDPEKERIIATLGKIYHHFDKMNQ